MTATGNNRSEYSPRLSQDVMTSRLYHVRPDDSLVSAWKLMREKKIRHLPVVDVDGEIVGILTDRDVQRAIHTETNEKGEVRFTIERFKPGECIKHYMTSPVQYVTADTPLETVAFRLLEHKMSSLLVTDTIRSDSEPEVIGIVTTDDLLWALIRKVKDDGSSAGSRVDSPAETVKSWLQSVRLSPIGEIARQLSNAGI